MKTIFKKNGGFTLVELIVVIAILAILAAVAIPAYSGYIDKTNQQVDLTLISDIKNALVLNYYADISSFEGGSIVSVAFDAPAEAYDDFAENAMKATFGENWRETTKLAYNGWKSNKKEIEGNNFQGNETKMLERVDYLTSSLLEPINAFVGDNFANYMATNGIDSTDKQTVSNAAVLYVANNTAKLSNAQQEEVINALSGAFESGGPQYVMSNVKEAFGGDLVSAAAVMYAVGVAYAEQNGKEFNPQFEDNMTPEEAGAAVNNAFVTLAMSDPTGAKAYLESDQVSTDVKAYVDIMSTVNTAKGQVIGKLDEIGVTDESGNKKTTWGSTYTGIFEAFNGGGIFVFLELDENGAPVADTTLVEE